MLSGKSVKICPAAILKLFVVPHQNVSMRAATSFIQSIGTPKLSAWY